MTASQVPQGIVPFYKERGQQVPRGVKGVFRNLKWWAMAITLAWWHLAPFMRWDRGPGAPNQAILIDMPGRRAYFFDIEIWPQEVYYITGILLMSAIFLFLMSAVAGRVWCGFLCWQTVYTDVFVQVERLVLGGRTSRLAFKNAPFSAGKLAKLAAVNLLWMAIGAACGIGFTLWFGDAFEMLRDIFTGEASSSVYAFILIIGGFCFLLAGYARERVCVYLCPYSRFQSAMLDEHSLVVSYEAWRGEPRGPAPSSHDFSGRGHCVDCKMCVISCPTGTDIRFGNQLSCIGCALCIDACDAVMDKFGLPRGLISYDSSSNLIAHAEGKPGVIKLVRPRTLIYVGILAIAATVMLTALLLRSPTDVNILHERAPLFVQMSDGGIRNGYVYKILNRVREDHSYMLKVTGMDGATMDVVGVATNVTEAQVSVPRDDVGTFRIYVTVPASSVKGKSSPITFQLTREDGRVVNSQSLFAAPE
ncbi:MAG: cytochrome c oxidase accessory protein CcoG [Actinomycetota bacterium]